VAAGRMEPVRQPFAARGEHGNKTLMGKARGEALSALDRAGLESGWCVTAIPLAHLAAAMQPQHLGVALDPVDGLSGQSGFRAI
jgi:hypothetical protein